MGNAHHWKMEIGDLRVRAMSVMTAGVPSARMSARSAARTMAGVVRLVATRWSVDAMQRACAELVRHAPAWRTGLGEIPPGEPIELIAVIARGLLTLTGADNLRDALAFWASEDDPAVWSLIACE